MDVDLEPPVPFLGPVADTSSNPSATDVANNEPLRGSANGERATQEVDTTVTTPEEPYLPPLEELDPETLIELGFLPRPLPFELKAPIAADLLRPIWFHLWNPVDVLNLRLVCTAWKLDLTETFFKQWLHYNYPKLADHAAYWAKPSRIYQPAPGPFVDGQFDRVRLLAVLKPWSNPSVQTCCVCENLVPGSARSHPTTHIHQYMSALDYAQDPYYVYHQNSLYELGHSYGRLNSHCLSCAQLVAQQRCEAFAEVLESCHYREGQIDELLTSNGVQHLRTDKRIIDFIRYGESTLDQVFMRVVGPTFRREALQKALTELDLLSHLNSGPCQRFIHSNKNDLDRTLDTINGRVLRKALLLEAFTAEGMPELIDRNSAKSFINHEGKTVDEIVEYYVKEHRILVHSLFTHLWRPKSAELLAASTPVEPITKQSEAYRAAKRSITDLAYEQVLEAEALYAVASGGTADPNGETKLEIADFGHKVCEKCSKPIFLEYLRSVHAPPLPAKNAGADAQATTDASAKTEEILAVIAADGGHAEADALANGVVAPSASALVYSESDNLSTLNDSEAEMNDSYYPPTMYDEDDEVLPTHLNNMLDDDEGSDDEGSHHADDDDNEINEDDNLTEDDNLNDDDENDEDDEMSDGNAD